MRFLAVALLCAMPVQAQDMERGAGLFDTYCASCHGISGEGGGPMASILTIVPPGLRGLQAENDGVFPVARVVMRIDGRDPVVSHGTVMPVFGEDFDRVEGVALKAATGQPILTSPPIADLVAFLQSIQE